MEVLTIVSSVTLADTVTSRHTIWPDLSKLISALPYGLLVGRQGSVWLPNQVFLSMSHTAVVSINTPAVIIRP